ncbi:hypothetical protein [Endozoicomonas sp. GU-1]|uniref:hypothetical protein n=1 Tax=Endozoicomonas sp. GU-1 TaxID=3009078 RepID=UPI0022B46080|nr:hypothetical protein [Endozoicomonas sp. GU-1]WBA80438.1 hypothetical protein O2T12_19165 [Endozoicomonas sp. GU-1]WBA88003.1 hypothetical protein O3276_08370 [Endozoicomonas sp. GU-1]
MINLPQTSTTAPAEYVPQARDEQVGQAGDKEVKPSSTGNECSKCPSESTGPSLQERAVALPVGNQDTQPGKKNAASPLVAPWLASDTDQLLNNLEEVMQAANNLLSTPIDQNLSEFNALSMRGRAYLIMGDLQMINNTFSTLSGSASHNKSETIDQKISELQQFDKKLEVSTQR